MFPELNDDYDRRIDYLNGYSEGARDAYGHCTWLGIVLSVVMAFAALLLCM